MKTNAVNWFEIYVNDFDRAKKFYDSILDTPLQVMQGQGPKMGLFPFDMEKGIGGAITIMDGMGAGTGGTLVYLNVEGEIDAVISRVIPAGGIVIRDRFAIPPHGFIAIIQDTEGNAVGLHSIS